MKPLAVGIALAAFHHQMRPRFCWSGIAEKNSPKAVMMRTAEIGGHATIASDAMP